MGKLAFKNADLNKKFRTPFIFRMYVFQSALIIKHITVQLINVRLVHLKLHIGIGKGKCAFLHVPLTGHNNLNKKIIV
jgi:hypothetical protein